MALLGFQRPVVAACMKHVRTKQSIEFEGLSIHPPLCVTASVSSGKSLMISHLAEAVHSAGVSKGNRVRVMVMARAGILVEQDSEAAWSIDLKNSVYSASAFGGRKSLYYDVVFCSEGTIARALDVRFAADKPWIPDMVIIDECFRAGTLIDGLAIENISTGDMVWSFNHANGKMERRRVVQTFKSRPSQLCTVKLESGESIVCTQGHPFYVPGEGYVAAASLKKGANVAQMHNVRERSISRETPSKAGIQSDREMLLLKGMLGKVQGNNLRPNRFGDQQKICIGTNETEEPDAQGREQNKGFGDVEVDGSSPSSERWKWKISPCSTDSDFRSSGGVGAFATNGVCGSYQDGKIQRMAAPLQAGCIHSATETLPGVGRKEPRNSEAEGAGCEERPILDFSRVDSVEIHQRTDDGEFGGMLPGGFVYNFEVEGNHNYFADGVLVHNCHQVPWDEPESQAMKTLLHFYRLRPHLRVIGMTGSPFRGIDSIIGPFWQKFASIEPDDPFYPEGGVGNGVISTEAMLDGGWIVGPQFGVPIAHGYDFSSVDWNVDDERELNRLTESEQLLAEILREVIAISSKRKGVLIFASTKRHARNIAKMLVMLGVPEEWVGLVVDSTPEKDKTRILKAAQTGEIKFTVNVGVLTTGINVPWWDTLCFLRPIGTLTLLTQAIGRVLRLLIGPDEIPMIERDALTAEERKDLIAASDKPDALILDFAGVMDRLGKLYENPVLEQAELERAKKQHETILCPECGEENSMHARRCIATDRNTKKRCEHFWSFRLCPNCGEKNDVVARQCRNQECAAELIDPNEKLSKTHFKDAEAIPVVSMDLSCGPGGALYVKWELSDGRKPIEIYYPNASKNPLVTTRAWFNSFCKEHVESEKGQFMARRMKNTQAVAMKTIFRVPTHIIARQNDKGKWTVGKRYFAVERVEEMV